MRSRELPIQPVPLVETDLAERLRVTARHLTTMPADLVSSVSLTAGWQGYGEAEVRDSAMSIAAAAGLTTVVEPHEDMVTITFGRPTPAD